MKTRNKFLQLLLFIKYSEDMYKYKIRFIFFSLVFLMHTHMHTLIYKYLLTHAMYTKYNK